jgi:hypothetical protein
MFEFFFQVQLANLFGDVKKILIVSASQKISMLPIKGQRTRDNIMRENPRVFMLCETIIPPNATKVDEKINGLFAKRFIYKKKYICIK